MQTSYVLLVIIIVFHDEMNLKSRSRAISRLPQSGWKTCDLANSGSAVTPLVNSGFRCDIFSECIYLFFNISRPGKLALLLRCQLILDFAVMYFLYYLFNISAFLNYVIFLQHIFAFRERCMVLVVLTLERAVVGFIFPSNLSNVNFHYIGVYLLLQTFICPCRLFVEQRTFKNYRSCSSSLKVI